MMRAPQHLVRSCALKAMAAMAMAIAVFAGTGGLDRAHAATFTVNSTGDGGDVLLADGLCADIGGACTLRAAIEQANFTIGSDIVNFGIGSGAQTISPATALPAVTQPMTINAATQPGFAGAPIIELSGSVAGASANGLTISAGSSTVRGLVVRNWGGYGIQINTLGGNTVAGNYIGTDLAGAAAQGNALGGVWVDGTPGNTIGGTGAGDRNLVSGHTGASGVLIDGPTATGNTVLGNYIGVDANGSVAIPNEFGVRVFEGPSNTIGGLTSSARNVISGNTLNGVAIEFVSTGTVVLGNYIGTNADGSAAIGNGTASVRLVGNAGNTIGGSSASARNVIAGSLYGVLLTSTLEGGHLIQGNYIGTDASGMFALANTHGVRGQIENEPSDITGNVISGNIQSSIITPAPYTVRGNMIGTAADGVSPLGNGNGSGSHIQILGAGIIGGTGPDDGNIIAYNNNHGVSHNDDAIRHNSIHSNVGLGINLDLAGVTPNDAGDADGHQNFPVITSVIESAGTTQILGTLNSAAASAFELDFFANTACDPSGHGEGETYIGSASVTTDAGGNVSFDEAFTFTLAGRKVKATATRAAGETSEFSLCFPAGQDTDGDGCSDAEENGTNPNFGGDRDSLSPWDFFDVPVPALPLEGASGARNKAVAITDAVAILYYVGTLDGGPPNSNLVDYDTDHNGNSVEDGREYDRTPSADQDKLWQSGPPNGVVTIQDVSVAIAQVGDNCAPPP